jgi:hypothetical protein
MCNESSDSPDPGYAVSAGRFRRKKGNPASGGAPPSVVTPGQPVPPPSQRSAMATPLVNPSPLGGQEHIVIHTTFLADGSLFSYLTIVPDKEAEMFQETFRRIGESIRLTDGR